MAIMTLCPKCRSIQKAGSICTICKCPIPPIQEDKVMNDKSLIKMAMLFFGAAFVFFFAANALCQVPDVDPSTAGSGLIDAIKGGQWGLAIGFGIMLLVWLLRVFVLQALNTKALPWMATAIGALAAFAAAMIAAPSQWLAAVMAGIQAGIAAAGMWGLMPSAVKNTVKPK